MDQLGEGQGRTADATKGVVSHIPQFDSSAIGQASKLADIASSVTDPIRDALAGTDFGSMSSSFPSSLTDEVTKAFDASALKLPDYDLGGAFEGMTPNYTIPDHSSMYRELSSYPKSSWQQLIILGNGFDLQCGLHSRFGDFFKPRFEVIAGIESYSRAAWDVLYKGWFTPPTTLHRLSVHLWQSDNQQRKGDTYASGHGTLGGGHASSYLVSRQTGSYLT